MTYKSHPEIKILTLRNCVSSPVCFYLFSCPIKQFVRKVIYNGGFRTDEKQHKIN